MRPLHELLNRVRWDREFGAARFELGYWDRVEGKIVRIALADAGLDHPEDETFALTAEDGSRVDIPLHRVRQVWRDGELIWSRPDPA